MDDSKAYSVAEWRLSTIDIRKARKAAVPSPPQNDSSALALYIIAWKCSATGAPASAAGITAATQA